MFGLDEISWGEFLKFIGLSLLLWYLFLLLMAWLKSRGKNKTVNFEDSHADLAQNDALQPIVVSSKNYPSEIIPLNPIEDIPLQASLYEENGYDKGLTIAHFMEKDSPALALMIPDIQYYHSSI